MARDLAVTQVLAGSIPVYHPTMEYYKYPKTWHLPWSPHNKRDDRKLADTECFNGREVVITEKMDGENTTLYSDHIHARSISSADHPSRSWVKKLHGEIKHLIPDGMRICGENLYAKHSILYDNLDSYFLVFAIFIDNTCLSWSDTLEYCAGLDLYHVPTVSKFTWDDEHAREMAYNIELWPMTYPNKEGYVVRVMDAFNLDDWEHSIAKYVRPNHIQTDEHWMEQEVIPNGLRKRGRTSNTIH
jgi:ATP-dependent RNA circularization protein (DNA/RNA ligase family)